MKKILGLSLAVILAVASLGFIGCTQSVTTTNTAPATTTVSANVTVKINYGDKKDVGTYSIAYTEGMTAFDALTKAATEAGGTIEATDSQYGKYIQAINGVKEDGTKFWLFTVNGEMAPQSSDATILKSGDSVEFNFQAM